MEQYKVLEKECLFIERNLADVAHISTYKKFPGIVLLKKDSKEYDEIEEYIVCMSTGFSYKRNYKDDIQLLPKISENIYEKFSLYNEAKRFYDFLAVIIKKILYLIYQKE